MLTAGTASPRIRLLREIASGPISFTFVAERDSEGGRELLAAKVLTVRTRGDVPRLLQLRDASRELASMDHRHIVCVRDVGRIGDMLCLVSPYVDGIDLLDWLEILREEGLQMPARVRCEVIRSIAVALDAALHGTAPGSDAPLGRVHRDIRPTNVMISRGGDLKVVDFGTGFTTLAGRAARAGALKKGIIKYMSPRRREGKRGGAPADIYSLGILAVELFRNGWLRRLQSHNPAHDRYLAEVVARLDDLGMRAASDELTLRNLLLRMVAFDPDARPDASEVASTLQMLADRARGPSLESYAAAHALPWMEQIDSAPDPDLEGVEVSLLHTGTTEADVPAADDLPGNLSLRARRSSTEAVWEETDEGWRQTGWERPDDLIEPFFDDEDTTQQARTPVPAAPPQPEPPQPESRQPEPPQPELHQPEPAPPAGASGQPGLDAPVPTQEPEETRWEAVPTDPTLEQRTVTDPAPAEGGAGLPSPVVLLLGALIAGGALIALGFALGIWLVMAQ